MLSEIIVLLSLVKSFPKFTILDKDHRIGQENICVTTQFVNKTCEQTAVFMKSQNYYSY
jgi:hypothetical protein